MLINDVIGILAQTSHKETSNYSFCQNHLKDALEPLTLPIL